MAKRGRKRVPTNVLKLRGSKQLYTRPKNEPIPTEGMPEPPEWLDDIGRQEWFKWSELLYEQGTLSLVDANQLGAYCDAVSDFIHAKELSKTKEGKTVLLIKTVNGNLIISPAYSVKRTARAEMTRLGSLLGMDASSRSGINLPKPKDKSDTKAKRWMAKNGA